MKPNRNYITPFISLTFIVVALSGMLMFFHLLDGYTEVVHEYLGLFFVFFGIAHIFLNWKGLRTHFKKRVFMPAVAGVFLVSILLIILSTINPPVDTVLLNKIVKAPIHDAFKALDINYSEAVKRLEAEGISTKNATTIESIWVNNSTDPEKVIDLLME